MVMAYNGKVLFIDLSSASVSTETLPENIYREFIGGQGLGARILYEHMKSKVDPLGSDNILGFVVGPLTGTGVHGARFQVVGKSPITGGWGDSNAGGSFAHELKAAGYDGVFLRGISSKPVFLSINDGHAELEDASHLWGKDTTETDQTVKAALGDGRVKVACIGGGGEAKSLIAGIMHEGSAAARGGLGAVMGSKLLKAIAVRGTKKVTIADPKRFDKLRREYTEAIRNTVDEAALTFKKWGTCGLFSGCLVAGDTPIKNWTLFGEEGFPNHANLDGDSVTKYQTKRHACLGCPIVCKGRIDIEQNHGESIHSAKIEYETLGMLGSNLLIDDVAAIAKANDLCNRYGLDTLSTGAAIAFAMECYEKGVLSQEDCDGLELTWGNASAMIAMVNKIGKREGFGAVLADGSKLAAERIGQGSEEWAMHIGGQDLPAHDPRVLIGCAWGYVCDPTPGRHTACEAANAFFSGLDILPYEELKLPHLDTHEVEDNAAIYAICSDVERLVSSAGICQFAYYPGILPIIDFINAATGWDISIEEGLKAGRRIATLRQAFNIREGVNTGEWHLPKRLEEPQSSGPNAGIKYNFKLMKARGYQALGWDGKTGRPLALTLEGLGLIKLIG